MGVDLCAITGHHLDAEQVYRIPSILSANKRLEQCAREIYSLNRSPKTFTWNLEWGYENSVEYIHEKWMIETNEYEFPLNISTSIGIFYLNRFTFVISFFCKYWYWGGDQEVQRKYFDFTETLATILNQPNVIFYPDSMHEQANMEEPGLTIDQIMDKANKRWGKPTGDLEKDISDYYYIQPIR